MRFKDRYANTFGIDKQHTQFSMSGVGIISNSLVQGSQNVSMQNQNNNEYSGSLFPTLIE